MESTTEDTWRYDLISSLIIFDLFIIIYSLHKTLVTSGLASYLYFILFVYAIFVIIYTFITERRSNITEHSDSVKYVKK